MDLSADSLPAPGPFIYTSTLLTPYSIAFFAATSAATWAAKGVPFLDPLKPLLPALLHASTLPLLSVIVIRVLLNVDCIFAIPFAATLFSFFTFAIMTSVPLFRLLYREIGRAHV